MDPLREFIGNSMIAVLPHLQHIDDLVDFVLGRGVKKERDLRHITADILNEILDYVDSCDLFEAWQKTYGDASVGSTPQQTESDLSRPGPSTVQVQPSLRPSRRAADLQAAADAALQADLPDISPNSPFFPAAVKEAIKRKKRPSAKSREDMVGRLVDRCRETIPNLKRDVFNNLAKEIVVLYPDSFKDTLLLSDHGSDSLAKQLKVKFDNDKRPKDSKVGKENTAPGLVQSYGCVEWSPALPDGETMESQERIMTELKEMNNTPRKDLDSRLVKVKLISSFYLQRLHINGPALEKPKPPRGKKRNRQDENLDNPSPGPSYVASLKENWPFLFTPAGMNIHFFLLTKVQFRDRLSKFITEESEVMIDFLGCKNEPLAKLKRQMIRAEKQSRGFARLVGLLLMLIQYFNDELSAFVSFTEKTDTYEDMQSYTDLPPDGSPVLVVAGTSLYEYERVFMFIDNVLVSSIKNIQEAFVQLFCAYFALNIAYAPGLSSFLCYTQRVIANINPVGKGSKCGNPHATRKANDKVVALVNKITEYKQKLEVEVNEEL